MRPDNVPRAVVNSNALAGSSKRRARVLMEVKDEGHSSSDRHHIDVAGSPVGRAKRARTVSFMLP